MADDPDAAAIDLIKFYTQLLTGLASAMFTVLATFLHNFAPFTSTSLLLLRLALVLLFAATVAGLVGVGRMIGTKGGGPISAYDPSIRIPFLAQLALYVLAMAMLLYVALTL
jgi:membrane-bound ClpP family serine protease